MPKRDAFSTLKLLNYGLRLLGLSCIYRDGTKLKHNNPIWKLAIYFTLFVTANVSNFYLRSQLIRSNKKITFSDAIHVSYLMNTVLYVIDEVHVYKYGRDLYIDYFNVYETIDSILGKPPYHEVKKCIRNMSLYYIIIAFFTNIIELYAWTSNFSWTIFYFYFIEFLYLLTKILAVLDVISNLVQVKYRLEVIGDLLEYCYYQDDNFPQVIKDVTAERVWISQGVRKSNHQGSSRAAIVTCRDIIKHQTKCYMLLIDQSEFINLKYGIRLLVICSIYLLDMVVLLNTVIRILMGNLVLDSAPNDLLIYVTLGRILTYTVIVFGVIRQCEQSYRQIDRIVRLINQFLINKKIGKETRETLTDFKGLITSRPLNYHAMNFFRVDYPTLVSMASVIATYTIILLQNLQ